MATIKGIKKASNRVIRFNNQQGLSFLIGVDDSDIASVSRVSKNSGEATQKFLSELNDWSAEATNNIRMAASSSSTTVANSIKARVTSNRYGEPIRVDFAMDRRGYYIYHGAGKSYGGLIGSKWNYKGLERTTNPKSIGRAGSGKRPAQSFLKDALDPLMDKLSFIVSEYMLENTTIALRLL